MSDMSGMSEQTLDRLVRTGLKVLVVAVALGAVVYFLERPHTQPTLVERQVAAGEKAARAHPNDVGIRLQLAMVYRAAHRSEAALEQFAAVLKVDPGYPTALLGRAEILSETGDLLPARQAFVQFITEASSSEFHRLDPQLEAAYYGLALVMQKQHQPTEAMVEVRKALAIEPVDADAWYVLGTAAAETGADETAVKAFQRAVLYVPLGWCEPYEQLEKVYAAQRRRPQSEYAGAMVELCQKRPAEAARRLEALTSGPVAIEAMLGLGEAAELQSQRASAARWYQKVIAADPENFDARADLTRLGVHTGGE